MWWILVGLVALYLYARGQQNGGQQNGGQGNKPPREGRGQKPTTIVRVMLTENPDAEIIWPPNTPQNKESWGIGRGEAHLMRDDTFIGQIGQEFDDLIYRWTYDNNQRFRCYNLPGDRIVDIIIPFPIILPNGDERIRPQ